jgi:S1-C subfamily serine protease
MVTAVKSEHGRTGGFRAAVLIALAVGLAWLGPGRSGFGDEPTTPAAADPAASGATSPSRASGTGITTAPAHVKSHLADLVLESDNWTFRPTVVVRCGRSQGSGTIIASVEGVTLVATAGHVIRGQGPTSVELHRYNLGVERPPTATGSWPRQVSAEIVAIDRAADVAILRVRNMVALPYVAQLARADQEPARDASLTSVGIDMGTRLSGWTTSLVEVLWFELNDCGTERPFLVTARIPQHGRSGGGLFDRSGRLVGICVGHAELVKGRRMGVFSSVESVLELIRKHELTSIVDRSEARRDRLVHGSAAANRRLPGLPRSPITPTQADEKPFAAVP